MTDKVSPTGLMSRVVPILLPTILLSWSAQTLAHHPLEGQPLQTLWHGLLSGLAHPLLGLDHLLFIIAIGMVGALSRRLWTTPLLVITGVAAGIALALAGIRPIGTEPAIALSMIIVGTLLFRGNPISRNIALVSFTTLGMFHGLAYADALTRQESISTAVLLGYLAGLALVQWTIAVGAGAALYKHVAAPFLQKRLLPIAGALVSAAGAVQLAFFAHA